jgi:hypothetical protein
MLSRFFSYLLVIHIFLFGSIFGCIEIIHAYIESFPITETNHCCTDSHNEKIQSGTALQYTQEGTYKLIPPFLVSRVFFLMSFEVRRTAEKISETHADKQSFFFTDTIRLLL